MQSTYASQLLFRVRAVKQQDSHINLKIFSQMNEVDLYFRVGRDEPLKQLMIRWSGPTEMEFVPAERLSEFYEMCRNVDIGHGDRFIKIEQPPSSFLQAMEEYVTEAPCASNVRTSVDHPSNNYSYYADTSVDDNHSVITHSRHVNARQEGVATDVQQCSRKPYVALSDTQKKHVVLTCAYSVKL
ncbi:putative clathrin assembly protein [Tanacetum coccineum]